MTLESTQVKRFLEGKLSTPITRISKASHGEWSQTFFFTQSNQEYVVRFNKDRRDFDKDKLAYRLAHNNLPIPKIFEIGEAFGGYYAISKRIPGEFIDKLDLKAMNSLTPEIVKMFDALRRVDLSSTQGFGNWNAQGVGSDSSWQEFLLSITKPNYNQHLQGWRDNLKRFKPGLEGFTSISEKFKTLVLNCPEERYLIHSDLLHYNLLVKDSKISGMIDWGNSLFGDFLYDIAWFAFWQFWYPSMKKINFEELMYEHLTDQGVNLANYEERLQCYKYHIAMDSIIYSAYKENWKLIESIIAQTNKIYD